MWKNMIRALLGLLILPVGLAGCRGGPAPTEAVTDGWTQVQTAEYSLLLPPGWEAHPVTAENLAVEFETLSRVSPTLAASLGGLQGLSLWAYDAAPGAGRYPDTLNVSRVGLGEGEALADLGSVLEALKAEYERAGVQVTGAELYQADDRPALRVAYSFRVQLGGQETAVEGRQFFRLAGRQVWTLSFSLDPAHAGGLEETVALSAASFHPAE